MIRTDRWDGRPVRRIGRTERAKDQDAVLEMFETMTWGMFLGFCVAFVCAMIAALVQELVADEIDEWTRVALAATMVCGCVAHIANDVIRRRIGTSRRAASDAFDADGP